MTRYLAVVLKFTGKQTITYQCKSPLGPKLIRFFTNNIFLYLHSQSSADFLFKHFCMANIHYDRIKECMSDPCEGHTTGDLRIERDKPRASVVI